MHLDLGAGTERRWPPEVEAALYFVACEAVSNALKHAPASAVRVRLTADHLGPQLQIADNGPGFSMAHSGAGLRGLRDRVESLGGRFAVESDGQGTVLTAEISAEPT